MKLIIVSNRLPVTAGVDKSGQMTIKESSGGLVSGLKEVHRSSNSIWIGYLGGMPQEDGSIEAYCQENRLAEVRLPPEIYDAFYNGYANDTLWPLFHNFLASMSISDNHWQAYVRANEAFADKIDEHYQPGDSVWVHDYQLMLVPLMLRAKHPKIRVAYFHHIPFPSSEIFRAIPRRKELILGLLGADYIGFHTYDYSRHFIQSTRRIIGAKTKINEITLGDRPVKVSTHPLGVDVKTFGARTNPNPPLPRRMAEKDLVTILGIDRLDYTKGLPERLQAFGRFLELNPSFRGKVRLIQVCVPSRQDIESYHEIRQQVEQLVGRINGEHSESDHIPIEYIYRSLPLEEVIEHYQMADIMMVTPLRDGLNLVCKEYVAARTDLDGCLILSEFAGASAEMGEALQVNPYDINKVAETIRDALMMDQSERRHRMTALRKRTIEQDNVDWAENFIQMWNSHNNDRMKLSQYLESSAHQKFWQDLAAKQRIFLFLDYDGTLAPIEDRPELAIPSKRLDTVMDKVVKLPNVITTIVTGRPREFCERYLVKYGTGVVAEHGTFLRSDHTGWKQNVVISQEDIAKVKPEVMELLESFVNAVPGSHVEIKDSCFVWHYRECDPEFAADQAQTLGENLEQMLSKTSWSVYHGKKTVEIRQSFANKGFGVETVLELYDWDPQRDSMITVGDDTTDEDMHRVQPDWNRSIHIGQPNSYSKYHLNNPEELYSFLDLAYLSRG